MPDSDKERAFMVEHHIAARGVRSALVLKAMGAVPREEFLPAYLRDAAYEDTPLPIGEEQTISQPYIVAFMVEALGLAGGEKVLEIGAGSGYARRSSPGLRAAYIRSSASGSLRPRHRQT